MVLVDMDSAVDAFPSAITKGVFPDLLGEEPEDDEACPADEMLDDLLTSFDEEDDEKEEQINPAKQKKQPFKKMRRLTQSLRNRANAKNTEKEKGQEEVKEKEQSLGQQKTPTDQTSDTESASSEEGIEFEVSRFVEYYENEGAEQESMTSEITPSVDEESSSDESTTKTEELLARAQERVLFQRTTQELEALKAELEKKREETNILAVQLRRATETKCDLVLLQTEMEMHHEQDLNIKHSEVKELTRANYTQQEIRAEIELEFMNEIAFLTEETREMRIQHQTELEDWERMHRNEMLEKEFEIAQLKQEILLLKSDNGLKKVRAPVPKILRKNR